MSDPRLDNGQQPAGAATSEFNALAFIVQQALGIVRTMTIVRVEAVYDSAGQPVTETGNVAPVGSVDVLPLVNLMDGIGTATEHVTVFGLPYVRLQGNGNAIIADPVKGDIGLALVSDRDISSVKSTKDQANPGSFRRFSLADSVYLGSILSAAPVQYLRFRSDGLELVDKNGNSIVLKPTGMTQTDLFGNVLDTHAAGVTLTDVNKNILDTSPTGITFTDLFGNVLATTSAGLTWTDVKGNVWASGASGITLTAPLVVMTGNLHVEGAVIGGFGGADQVGLQTHTHSDGDTTPSHNVSSPNAGT